MEKTTTMKNITLLMLCLSLAITSMAQSQSLAAEARLSLVQRFAQMKSASQTYKEYKVIPEVVLDQEWAIVLDSVKAFRRKTQEAGALVLQLKSDLHSLQLAMQEKEEEAARTEYAATHINFCGMNYNKTAFNAMVILMFGAFLVLLGMLVGRLKIVSRVMHEKNEIMEIISREFEEYKRKMLEKQTKLSRELQNERNKLMESGRG